MYRGEVGESENPNGAVRARSERGTDAGSGRRLLARETEPGSAPDLRQNHSAKALSRENPVSGRPFHARQAGARFRLPSTGDPDSPHTGREAMMAANGSEPTDLAPSRAKGPPRGPRRRSRVSMRAIGLWLVVGGLSALFALIAVAVALTQIRNFQPMQLGVALLFLAPIGGAIAAIVLYARSMGRATIERTQAVEAARGSQAALAAIVENSDDAIIGKTLDGRITTWNRGAERMYGYTASEAIGQPISLLVPEDRRDELALVMERLRRGEAIHHLETTRVRKDGRKIDAAITISPIRDASGRLVGAATIARDVTDQTQLQRRLLESERWGSMG